MGTKREYYEKGKEYKIVTSSERILEISTGGFGKGRKKEREVFKTQLELAARQAKIKAGLVGEGYALKNFPSSCFKTTNVEISSGVLTLHGKMQFGDIFYQKRYQLVCLVATQKAWYVGGNVDDGKTITFGPFNVEPGSKKFKLKFETSDNIHGAFANYKGDIAIEPVPLSSHDYPLFKFGNPPQISRIEEEYDRLLPVELRNYYHMVQGNGVNVKGHGYIFKNIIDEAGVYAQVSVCNRFSSGNSGLIPLAICSPDKLTIQDQAGFRKMDIAQISVLCLDKINDQGNGKVLLIKNTGERIEMFESISDLISYSLKE